MTATESAGTARQSRRRVFGVTFAVLAFANAVCTVIGWFHSVDVKGWWLLGLGFGLSISCLFALVLSQLRSLSLRCAVVVGAALGAVLVAHACLYYLAPPDWLAVNKGEAVLTPMQSLVYSDYTVYAIYAVFVGFSVVCAQAKSLWRG